MRYATRVCLAVVLMLGLAACGNDGARTVAGGQTSVSDVLERQTGQGGDGAAPPEEGSFSGDAAATYAEADIDVDLTTMSADMVYATVYDMMTTPSSYLGKVVRMQGPMYHQYYEETGNDYFYVIIQDATACCAQGLEFVWGNGSHVYPDEYPADETQVVVTGRFETYEESGSHYAHLVDASLVGGSL